MSGGELPPVAASSSLIAPMPMVESRDIDADGGDGGGVSFGTQDLAMALTRSQQHNNVGGMRRTCSAPHSMDALGVPDVLAPSGGPMRRVASSVGMRRSNSFFWTPAAHHEFEAACEELARSGIVPTAPAILHAMAARPDLKIADIDKHLKVSTRTPRAARNDPPSAPSPPARSAAPALALRRPPTAPPPPRRRAETPADTALPAAPEPDAAQRGGRRGRAAAVAVAAVVAQPEGLVRRDGRGARGDVRELRHPRHAARVAAPADARPPAAAAGELRRRAAARGRVRRPHRRHAPTRC